jgi:hypothetical protein
MRMLAAPATGALDSRGYWVPAGFFPTWSLRHALPRHTKAQPPFESYRSAPVPDRRSFQQRSLDFGEKSQRS